MSVNGNYGVVLQITEEGLQSSLDAFVAAQDQLFHLALDRQLAVAQYALREDLNFVATLRNPQIRLVGDRTIALGIDVVVAGTARTRLEALPGGPQPAQPPALMVALSGRIEVEAAAVRTAVDGRPCLAIDLRALRVTRFDIAIGSSNITLSPRALAVLSAIARRSAVVILSKQVGLIPVGFELDFSVPILGDLHIPVVVDYKIVTDGRRRALAVLLQVMNEPVDWNAVSFAVADGVNFSALLALHLIQFALDRLCAGLEGYRVFPDEGGIKGDLIFHDAHMHVEPGWFVLDELKVQSKTLQRIERVVETVICTAIDPCNAFCRNVFETIIEWVQLDQLAHASGRFAPYVQDGRFRVDASGVDADLSLPIRLLIFTGASALLPLGTFVGIFLIVIGKILLGKVVTGLVEKQDATAMIDRRIPGTPLHVRADATTITWPDGCLAVHGNVRVEPA
ncbi:MAG TPA: hypothetical protein VEC60_09315 [Reyranella sp.]|nr:hypothetical protein [Reyranella sp.]